VNEPEETHKEPAVLLSRVAEAVYWTGRYLERAETTARIIKVHTELYLDLPKSAGIGWTPLLAVTGSEEAYGLAHDGADEDRVVSFLVSSDENPGSLLASLAAARENLRVTRAVFPRETWETLNALYVDAADTCAHAISRRTRLRWTDEVVAGCQRISGALAGTMSHDAAYSFLRLGSHLERADMTTRVLDVRAGMPDDGPAQQEQPYADLLWMSVLRSLGAQQMYRRSVQNRVWGADVLRFLLRDRTFPRSFLHCLDAMENCLGFLPNAELARAACIAAAQHVEGSRTTSLSWGGLHDYVDELQLDLVRINDSLCDTYFHREPGERLRALASA
jgi:uncharacterized alpha-E superfamily protein